MKKINTVILFAFTLFFVVLFLGTNVVKAGNCGAANCTASQTCCNTGCCDNATQYCYADPNLGGRCVSLNSGVGGAAGAGVIENPVAGNLNTQSGISLLQTLITDAITILFAVGAVIFFFMLIFGGIQWIGSGGDKQAIEGAKAKITNALIGLLILFAVFVITRLIGTFFSIDLLHPVLPVI